MVYKALGPLSGDTNSSVTTNTYALSGGSPAATPTFSPGAGTYSSTQTVTISTTSSNAIICWNTTGAPGPINGGTTCPGGSTLINGTSGMVTVSASETLYAVAGGTGYSDSTVGSASYTISGPSVYYYIEDSLGSSRVITDSSGNLCYDADFYPFGGERPYTTSCSQNYKFTGKERDSESNLDNFGARYNSSSIGRFMSPDWSAKTEPVPYARLDNPQSLNLYSYVLNSPLVHRDADGHIIDEAGLENNKKYLQWKKNYLSHPGAQKQWDALNDNKNLTVHLHWDNKSSKSVTDGYQFDKKSGNLTSVMVTLAGKTGDPSNPMSASSGYIHGSTLNDDAAMRQAYVIAHEFAHVEYAEEPEGGASLRQDEQTSQHLKDLYNQFGPRLYSTQPGVGDMQRQLDQNNYDREKGADQRAWDVLGDPK